MLKGVIFSLHDVLAKAGPVDASLLEETLKLLRYLKSRGVEPVFMGNTQWTVTYKESNKTETFKAFLEGQLGPVSYYVGGLGGMPFKPLAAATSHVLADKGWTNREAILVGNSENDMRTAQNGNLLFLNALWHGTANLYGFQFNSPRDVARFVDCLALGLADWFWALEEGKLRVYSLAPFTTLSPKYTQAHAYSASARATSKDGAGDANFWGRLLAARVYFSGLVDEVDYITAYPGHAPDSNQTVIAEALNILGQSLRKRYLPDLIARHAKAVKSQTARAAGGAVGIDNQLTTIRLNPAPAKGLGGVPYKKMPLKKGKTVLLVDDICTEGNSFEAGRTFLEATGAETICLSWLKTINTDYRALASPVSVSKPYTPLTLSGSTQTTVHSYSSAIVSPSAPTDLAQVYNRYFSWAWPPNL